MSKILTILKNPSIIFTSIASRGWLDFIPTKTYLSMLYRICMKKKCDFKNPRTYNEKLQWLKLYDHNEKYFTLVDKYEVKAYIKEKLGEKYLIPTLGIYNSFDEIDFEKLPNEFVIKCTHDSGSVIVCKDKEKFDINGAKKKINKAMRRKYYSTYREWPYKNVKHRIIVEKFMKDGLNDDLRDYKVLCFNGKPTVIEVHDDRFNKERGLSLTYYDTEWNRLDISDYGVKTSETNHKKPELLSDMLSLSEKLAKNIINVRIDWYVINGALYFGEITLYDGSGMNMYDAAETDLQLGNMLDISELRDKIGEK